jgi:NRPS condensation-like uncharacterized protein
MEQNRELGFAESFLHEFYEKLNGGLVTVVMARLNSPLKIKTIEERIKHAWYYHPLLHHHIKKTSTGRYFFVTSKDDFIPKLSASNLPSKQLFNDLLQSIFPSEESLWSVHYTTNKQPHLILKIHHAIADGTAARALLMELISGSQSKNDHESNSSKLLPSVEELLQSNVETINEPLPSQGNYPLWKYHGKAKINDRICHTDLFEINAESVIQKAHNHQISVNAIFMAATINASKALQDFPKQTSVVLPVSVRHLVSPPINENEMGCYIGNALVFSPEENEKMDFFELAKNLNNQLHKSMQASITAPANFNISNVDNSVKPFQDSERADFGFNLAISNLGVREDETGLIDALWFGASIRPGHIGILISIVTINNKFCIGLNFTEPLVEHKEVLKFKVAFEKLLDNI